MVKVTLVYPPTIASLDRDISATYSVAPISMAYIAAFLKEKGIAVSAIDAKAEKLSLREIEKRINLEKPDIVGLTAATIQIYEAHTTAKLIKQINKEIVTVIGGWHASAIPKETLAEFPYFDFAVYGEGEVTMYELVKTLENGGDVSTIKGIAYRGDGEIRLTEPHPYIKNLDEMPFPAYELFPLDKYRFYAFKRKMLELPVSTSRGCPHKCSFCYKSMGDAVRLRSIESVINEIKRDVEEFGARRIMFIDDTFTLNKKRVVQLCDRLISEGLDKKISWMCETRVDAVDRQLLEKMRGANCVNVSYGIESGNQTILDTIVKNINLKQAQNAVKWAKETGMEVDTNFILGNQGETRETALDTINFAAELDADRANFSILVPYPGTQIMEMAEKRVNGLRLLTKNWRKYGRQMGGALSLESIDRRELEKLQMKAYLKFYLRPGKITNLLKILNIKSIPILLLHQVNTFLKRENRE